MLNYMKEIIDGIRNNDNIKFNKSIADRLEYLIDVTDEDIELGQYPLAQQSLESFVEFITNNSVPIYPGLALTPIGNIYAKWKIKQNQFISIEFTNNEKVKYVGFKLNNEGGVSRASGEIKFKEIPRYINHYVSPKVFHNLISDVVINDKRTEVNN